MRTIWIALGGMGLMVAQMAHADIMLEDFNGITVSETYPSAEFHSGNLRTSGLKSSYCFYNAGGMNVSNGQLTATFTGNSQLFELKFGTRATSPDGSFSNDVTTFMNANWSNVTGIKLNFSSLSAPISAGTVSLYTNNSQSYLLGISSGNSGLMINSPGSFVIPITNLSPDYLSGADLADVDAVNLSFWITVAKSVPVSWTLDSVELVTVPEPASVAPGALGAAALLLRRRRA